MTMPGPDEIEARLAAEMSELTEAQRTNAITQLAKELCWQQISVENKERMVESAELYYDTVTRIAREKRV